MVVKATVTNFLGIREAVIPLPRKPVMVVGHNASGKTSAATALGSLLAGNANPLGLRAGKAYLRDNEQYGEVLISGPAGQEWRRWVIGERGIRKFAEAPPDLSAHAMALVDFINVTEQKARARIWEQIFLPDRSQLRSKLQQALEDALPADSADLVRQVLSQITTDESWDATGRLYAGHATAAKRAWQDVSGTKWGVKKAAEFRPEGWVARLDSVTEPAAREALNMAEETLRSVEIESAISEADHDRAKAAAASLPKLRDDFAKLNAAYDANAENLRAGRRKTSKLEGAKGRAQGIYDDNVAAEPEPEDGSPCPHCGKSVVTDANGALFKAEDPEQYRSRHALWRNRVQKSEDARDEAQADLEKHAGRVTAFAERVEKQRQSVEALRERIRQTEREAKRADMAVLTEDLEQRHLLARQARDDKSGELRMVKVYREAVKQRDNVFVYEAIAKLLGPLGVRQNAVSDRIKKFQKFAARIAAQTGWPLVSVDKGYVPHVGNRPAALCSESEKWRCQLVIQCALAIVNGDRRVIADGVDVLDSDNWNAYCVLCEYLARECKLFVIGFGTTSPALVPEDWDVALLDEGRTRDD